jgi:penicillin-binding protein 1C
VTLRRKVTYGFAGVIACTLLAIAFCPRPDLYGNTRFSTAIQDRNGKLMRLALADDDRYRLWHSLDDIASTAVDATLLYEDRYFRSHPGFNPGALGRAIWSTYVLRGRPLGASTITMQLVRLRYSMNTRTIGGKLMQIARAVQFERHYSKDAIVEAYLNLAPYGGNIEGIGTASLIYFDKPASQLALPEALALAVIAQNPVKRDPSTSAGYQELDAARSRLLTMWIGKYGLGKEEQALFDLPLQVRSTRELPFHAPHFSQEVLADKRDEPGVTRTTLDLDRQSLIEQRIEHYVERRRGLGIRNASAMLLDYRTMEVVASIGSADFFAAALQGQVSGTTAKRSPGSTLKPFVYGLAIDRGIIHPMSLLQDAPARFAAYTPENFDRGFMGPIKAQDALIYSRNVPAIELLARVGHETFHDFLTDANVAGLRNPDHYGLAMILGGNELTMQELVALYAMLANGGLIQPLVTITGEAVPGFQKQLLSPEASFLVLDMLRKNPRPDSVAIHSRSNRRPVAWKTGTSYAFRDAWTVGVFGPYVLAVWVGNFDGSSNPAFVGRSAAAPLFFEIVDALQARLATDRYDDYPAPGLNLRRIEVCADTGDLPGRYCPGSVQSWFIPGKSPITVSNVHRAIRIDNATGKRSCSFDPSKTRVEVFEFWPSDILRLFRKAGIAIRRPPPWSDDCAMDVQTANGIAPRITSPSSGLTYHVRPDRIEDEQIPLQATTDSDVEWLYWFANERFVAKVRRDEPYFFQPRVGEYNILAIDDLGRGRSRHLSVELAR